MLPRVTTLLFLVAFGVGYRIWPILADPHTLSNFFLTEDGYLLLTVARNIAIGNGMSVSDGTIATNGVQPLTTFLFAIPYLLTNGDKLASLVGVHLIQTVIALGVLFALRALAVRILSPRDTNPIWPWIIALFWFLGPGLMRHSMNGLETSAYTLMVLLTLLVFARLLEKGNEATLPDRLAVGAMCGLTVLTRNDAVFFVTALFATWSVVSLWGHRTSLASMIARLVPPGLLSIAIALPWLVNNLLRFGSIIPVSGTAQMLASDFGKGAPLLPAKLFEHSFPMLPIPSGLETNSAVTAITMAGLVVVIGLFLWRLLRHSSPIARALMAAYLGTAIALSVYYSLFFGAQWFLGRYLAPLAPLLILASVAASLELGRWLVRSHPEALARLYAGCGLVLSVGFLVYALGPGRTHQGHEQVVAWTYQNVPTTTWVGAVQTGTLGYWHDRTINFDGKVNPEALRALQASDGLVQDYALESGVTYIIDWAGVGDWVHLPESQNGFSDAFELIVQDHTANLSVMRRRD